MDTTRGLSSATLSTQSTSLTCRICQDGNSLEPLLNACDCSGSIGLVHAMCLEKWLSQSSRESCELCQYEFKTVKKVKNFQQVRIPCSSAYVPGHGQGWDQGLHSFSIRACQILWKSNIVKSGKSCSMSDNFLMNASSMPQVFSMLSYYL